MSDTIPMTLSIPRDRLYSLLVSANDNGSGYWARIVSEHVPEDADLSWLDPDDLHDGAPRWPHYVAPLVGGSVTYKVIDDDARKGKRYTLNAETILRGLTVMAEKYPQHLGDFLSENDDANTADVFLQCCLLGDVEYG